MLVGRGREWDELFTVVGAAREGKGRALVLHGPPGVGKSALLTGVTETCAPGMRALRATGVEGEAGLPFAALHQLLRPLLPGLGELPRPQADALCGAFGMSAVRADRFLVGLATLSLLSNASAGTPLLITVDDAHWLDPASAEALVFLARRLESEAVALLLATRNDAGLFPLPGVPDLQILPLNDADAAGLLARTLPKTVPTVRKRLLREARGHPLALVELPAALSPCHLDGTTPLPDPLPLSERQRKFFHDPAAGLTDVQRDVLLLAAAAGDAEPSTVLRACADADAARDALFEAVSTGVIRLDQREVTFRHPLARSAVYHGASFRRRRAAHLALARSLAPDDDRRVWHLAAASVGPDDAVARLLTELAERARHSGDPATAGQALRRAAELASEPLERALLLVEAAEYAWMTADTSHAETLLKQAEALDGDPRMRARVLGLRGAMTHAGGDPAAACRLLLDGARLARETDAELTAELLVTAARAAWAAGDPATLTQIAELGAGPGPAEHATLRRFSRHFAYLGSLTPQQPGPARYRHPPFDAAAWLLSPLPRPWVWPPVLLPHLTGGTEAMTAAHRSAADALRAAGADGALAMSLTSLVALELVTGQWSSGLANGVEGLRLAQEAGQPGYACHLHALLAWLAAAQGDSARCRALAEQSLAVAAPHHIASALALAHWALGLNALAEGRPDQAARLLGDVVSPGGPAEHFMVGWLVLPDLAEAWVRSGDPAPARAALARFEQRADPERAPHLHAPWHRCRALLSTGERTSARYESALEAAGASPFDIGRTHLLYGEWLRRNRRIKSAREHLHQATTHLHMLGARPWIDLALEELRAAGDRSLIEPAADPASVSRRLTPRELQIARLAARGMSNSDIAAQLFLSPRTVGYHLHKLFPKLGITSRTQLYGRDLS